MSGKFGIAFICLCLTSCASFDAEHEQYIGPAIDLQRTAISSPLFAEILLELEEAGEVDWDERIADNDALKAEVIAFPNPMLWLLEKYETPGVLERANLKAWRKLNPPWSKTTAAAGYGSDVVLLNLTRFNRDKFQLANTFIHEQNHTFGHVHVSPQTRKNNMCDAGYLTGDLAEAILRSSAGMTAKSTRLYTCPALVRALEARGIWSASGAGS